MRFTPTRAAAALALAFGILGSSTTNAVQPQPFEGAADGIQPVWKPVAVDRKPVTVVLQLSGEAVAERQGNAGRKLNGAEKQQIKAALKAQQDSLRSAIESRGGQVLAQFQVAYNGIKVRISRDRAGELATLPGVVAVRPLQVFTPSNVRGLPLIGTPAVWDGIAGLHGEGVKIAIIDTGIDYTHANFGGPGTAAAFALANASDTAPADPALFGPLAPRIKGGIDLVGDAYNAAADETLPNGDPNPALIPRPDPNPLDCNGHGSHVAGSAAGSGVTSAGATYTGPYNSATLANPANFHIGPGVAPKADLYAVRVFGCAGSTDVTVEAIEWAVDNDMDVINMSLGSPFGTKDDPSAVASTNAAKAGVIVVTSAGNSGASQYITGSPGTGEGSIATAASDPTPKFPGALINIPSGPETAINANGAPSLPAGSLSVKVLRTATGAISLGCNPAEYVDVAGKIVVTARGTCARVARAVFGQQAGAAAVVMVNNANSFPPFEGVITGNPDTGEQYLVTIPFLGVPSSRGAALNAANGASATLAATEINNPAYKAFASFTSGGPRTGDSGLKPDITAPGQSIFSTAVGTGNVGSFNSGTSMAAPHVAGVAALTRQAHPGWKVEDIKSAIVHTGKPSDVTDYRTSRGGTGLVQPAGSTATQVVARTSSGKFDAAINFGVEEMHADFAKTKSISLRNHGSSAATFNVTRTAGPTSRSHTVTFSSPTVTVPAGGDAELLVTVNVPAATAGSASAFREVVGLVELTPQSGANSGVTLRVPYYLVARAQSDVSTSLAKFSGTSTTATVTNKHGVVAGSADFYAWGLSSGRSSDQSNVTNDVRAVGVQSFVWDAANQLIVFAVNTYNRWSNAATNEFDIYVDVDGDGTDDYIVVGADQGAVQTGVFNGVMGSFVFSTRTPGASINFLASAPSNGSTALLPVLSSQLCRAAPNPCLSAANPRLTYRVVSFDLNNGGAKAVAGSARYNAWSSSITQGGFVPVAPGATGSTPIAVNPAEAALTPALGVMVVTTDNKSAAEAQLIPVGGN